MNDKKEYRPLPILENHKCFACGHLNPSGLRMEFLTDEKSVFSSLKIPEHLCGWNTLVHGGIISAVLDEIMSWSAIYLLKKVVLTKSITVDFVRPVSVGRTLNVEGKILELKGKREALVEGAVFYENGMLRAKSRGTFALLSPEAAIRLNVVDENALNELAPLIQH